MDDRLLPGLAALEARYGRLHDLTVDEQPELGFAVVSFTCPGLGYVEHDVAMASEDDDEAEPARDEWDEQRFRRQVEADLGRRLVEWDAPTVAFVPRPAGRQAGRRSSRRRTTRAAARSPGREPGGDEPPLPPDQDLAFVVAQTALRGDLTGCADAVQDERFGLAWLTAWLLLKAAEGTGDVNRDAMRERLAALRLTWLEGRGHGA